jgi:HNH endonuclease/NUMOD3 motif
VKIEKTCISCNGTYFIYPSEAKRRERKFCGRKCDGDARKGVKKTEAHRQKISLAHKGMKKPWAGSKKGRKIFSLEARKKMSFERRGENATNWRGGITPKNLIIRHSLEYKLWRQAVFERDSYTCVLCGDNRGGNLQADHIKPFALYPELRLAIDNGRTLCIPCHKLTPSYGGKFRTLYSTSGTN